MIVIFNLLASSNGKMLDVGVTIVEPNRLRKHEIAYGNHDALNATKLTITMRFTLVSFLCFFAFILPDTEANLPRKFCVT